MTPQTPLREAVRWFAEEMNTTLNQHRDRDHQDEDGWIREPLRFLLQRLHEEIAELDEELGATFSSRGHLCQVHSNSILKAPKIIGEAIDVANLAMMIADVARKNPEIPTDDDPC